MKTFSKQFLSFSLFALACAVCAGEVVFIPGWFTEKTRTVYYETMLRKIYPGKTVTVLTWQSNSLNMNQVIENADAFADSVAEFIKKKTEKEQAELVLIGHSFGGRIVAKAASDLAKNRIAVRRIIQLGAAVDFDADLNDMIKCSRDPVINVFSRNDSVLKYLYGNWKQKFAIGFSGAETIPPEHFVQYHITASEPEISNLNFISAALESIIHFSEIYLAELERIQNGELKPYKPKYDYSDVVITKSILSVPSGWMIPPVFQMDLLDSHAEWVLAKTDVKWKTRRKNGEQKEHRIPVYFIIDPYGRIALWNLLRAPLESRFQELRTRIKPLPDPDAVIPSPAASAPE